MCKHNDISILHLENKIDVFKALSDPNRLKIILLLRSGEKCACELLDFLHINQSTLSHHMKILCDSALVSPRIEGKWTYYTLSKDKMNELIKFINFIKNEQNTV